VTGDRTGGVPGIGTVDGIGVTGGSGRRVGSVGGGSSYAVGMWVCAVGGGAGLADAHFRHAI
jgi:hypothetical protein